MKTSSEIIVCLGVGTDYNEEEKRYTPVVYKVRIEWSKKKGYWRSNVPWSGFGTVTFPNGTQWDLSTFATVQENPWPIDEPVNIEVRYTGWIPPGYVPGMNFGIVVGLVENR